jgi:hypothetical protein
VRTGWATSWVTFDEVTGRRLAQIANVAHEQRIKTAGEPLSAHNHPPSAAP